MIICIIATNNDCMQQENSRLITIRSVQRNGDTTSVITKALVQMKRHDKGKVLTHL